jgi:hypothetical protein
MSPSGFVAVFSDFVLWLLQVALFGVMVCTIGATALAGASGFRSDHKGFANRFLFFLWRYCLPAWVMMELAVWVFTGRIYPV